MARPREHLEHAPIAEAVIDFRVLPREDVTVDHFAGLTPHIGSQYNQATLMQSIQARFGIDRGLPVKPTQVQSTVGWMYQMGGAVAQFRTNGFTFSKLEPYTTWDDVFGEAQRLWSIYLKIARPLEAKRLAVRYINRLRVPSATDLRDYLEAPPVLPPPIPSAIREFLTRVLVFDSVRNASAILIQALEALDPTTIQILLDIDAFRDVALPPGDPSLLEVFEQLRSLKNDIFFASVTEKTVEMYE
jgi:uncharacterized protein (TIGR04255 family)